MTEKSLVPPPMSAMSASSSRCDGLLIVMGRRDRLVHERDVAKAHPSGNGFEHRLGARVRRVVVIDEAHRPAVHDGRDLPAGEGFGLVLQMAHEDLDDFP